MPELRGRPMARHAVTAMEDTTINALRLVSLDLDGTLIHPAIFNVVADALGFGEPLQWSYREYLEGRMTLEQAFHHDIAYFVDRPVDAMLAALERSDCWTAGIEGAVRRFHAAGLSVVVTTDQPRFLAEATLRFGVDALVCSEAEVVAGRFTGRVEPRFDKWPNLESHLARAGIAPSSAVHVGNGSNDVPIFRNVGLGVAVNCDSPEVLGAAALAVPSLDDLGRVCALLGF